jgi:hypothetical protein
MTLAKADAVPHSVAGPYQTVHDSRNLNSFTVSLQLQQTRNIYVQTRKIPETFFGGYNNIFSKHLRIH